MVLSGPCPFKEEKVEITLRARGGLAGGEEAVDVDTATLATAERDEIESLVRRAEFFSLPAVVEAEIGADLPQYELSVHDGDREHTVTFVGETGEAELLHDLVERVVQASSGR